jgi:plasmid stabilization system protein ParE
MKRVIFSRQARCDLQYIGRYIAKRNAVAAAKWVARLRRTCTDTIRSMPGCGTMCDHLLPGMRCFSVGSYLIYFKAQDTIRILRIVHGAMEQDELEFEL